VCEDFLNEVWKNKIPTKLDSELSSLISCFLQNNLNIAETARQLHMHRNTLIYRIEKIEAQTNLDIRNFEDAMTLRLALMIMNNRK
jgi:carbohydrate diacid regulator